MNLKEILTPKRITVAAIILLILIFFSRQLATTLVPFVIGIFLAAILDPIISFLEKRLRFPRTLAAIATLLAAGLLTSYILFFAVSRLITELVELASLLPAYTDQITELTNDLLGHLQRLNESVPAVVSINIQHSIENFLEAMENGTRNLINRVLAAFTSLPTFVLVSVIALVSTYFVSRDKELILDTLLRFVPARWRDQVSQARERIAVDLVGFIKGRLLMLIVAMLIAGIGLFWIGTRYWVLLALIIGILDNIPVIGPGVIFTPWVAVSAIGGDINRAIYLTILYFIIFSVRQLVEPKIMGDSVGIHPLVMLVAIYGGIVFFGVLGIFIGPLIAILIKAAMNSGLLRIP